MMNLIIGSRFSSVLFFLDMLVNQALQRIGQYYNLSGEHGLVIFELVQ